MTTLRPSPPLVISMIAMFVALSGTAVALDGSNTVFSDDIVDGEVRNADIGPNAVGSGQINDGAVRSGDIRDGAVHGADIDTNAVANPELASRSVGFLELQFDSVHTSNVMDDTLRGRDVNDGSLTGDDIDDDSLTGDEIADGAVGTADLASTIPAVRAEHGSNQTIGDGGLPTTLRFNDEMYDTASLHSTGSNNPRLTAPVDGIYVITGAVKWFDDGDGDGWRSLFIAVNGKPASLGSTISAPAAAAVPVVNGADTHQVATTQARLSAGDFVELTVWQNSGESKLIKCCTNRLEFSMAWVAPG